VEPTTQRPELHSSPLAQSSFDEQDVLQAVSPQVKGMQFFFKPCTQSPLPLHTVRVSVPSSQELSPQLVSVDG
jgi:hypothetical protein